MDETLLIIILLTICVICIYLFVLWWTKPKPKPKPRKFGLIPTDNRYKKKHLDDILYEEEYEFTSRLFFPQYPKKLISSCIVPSGRKADPRQTTLEGANFSYFN
jgi:hypothetical protein